MRIFENQITVLLGHNGAGKTTLLNMITGFTSCSEGNVLVGGYDVVTCTKDARESFGYCAQDNILFDDLTVEEHLIFFAVDIEKNSADLGIDCLGMTVTSLEDVLIRVGEEHQVQQQRKSFDAAMDEATIIDAKGILREFQRPGDVFAEPLIALMATTVSTEPSFVSRMWTLLSKKATCIWRQKKQPLFSWLLPPLLLSLLFQLENVALYHTTHVAQHVGDTLSYTFIDVMQATKLRNEFTSSLHTPSLGPCACRTLLWYNGEIQHSALLIMRLFNEARLRYVTGVDDAHLSFDVTELDYGANKDVDEPTRSRDVYRELLPKVLRSIFLPLASSLMCSNFVLFPIAERALQVKHLHIITGVSPFLYWASNFVWDFMFYMGTAIFVLPPIAYFHADSLDFDYIPSVCCLGSVFMEHYAATLNNGVLTLVIRTVLQFARLLPNYSYSRGMTKVLQLAAENALCRTGGQALRSACHAKTATLKMSLEQCCMHADEPNPELYAISPLGVHWYSAFYEVLTLFFEGPLLFALLLCADYYWLRRLDRHLSEPEPTDHVGSPRPAVTQLINTAFPKSAKHEDTDVADEAKVVEEIATKGLQVQVQEQQQELPQQLPQQPQSPEVAPPAMVVYRLAKAYGYVDTNVVLQASFGQEKHGRV
ncbi:hypothetical protein V5799_010634 [Amblyomma americanum]|uniref:Abc transporter n=1 Tax=Amblyomma americanum TaxID=6943 RepID=A0AAQ4EJB5_AMBAM